MWDKCTVKAQPSSVSGNVKTFFVGRTKICCSQDNSGISNDSRCPTAAFVCSWLEKVGFHSGMFLCMHSHVMAAISKATLGSLGKGKLARSPPADVFPGFTAQSSPVLFQESSGEMTCRTAFSIGQVVVFCYSHHHNWKNSEKLLFSRYRCFNFYCSC